MYPVDIDTLIKDTENLKNIYTPKLEALANSGNGSFVHKANNFLLLIRSYFSSAIYYYNKNDSKVISHMVTCKEYIKSAIEWMEGIGEAK